MADDAIARTSLLIAAAALVQRAQTGVESLDSQIGERALVAAGDAGRRLHRLATHACGRALLALAEGVLLPGLSRHYAWRKRGIARWVEAEHALGATQLIVLGAGFDALAARFARSHRDCVVIEIDRPASSALKHAAVAHLGAAPANLHLLAADLARESIEAVLSHCRAFDGERRTIVVAEGLLMYVEPWRIARMMQSLGQRLQASTTLIGTAMAQHADGRVGFKREARWVATWLRRRGEPFLWGADAARLHAALHAMHLELEEIADPAGAADPDPCPGEWLFRAHLLRARRRSTADCHAGSSATVGWAGEPSALRAGSLVFPMERWACPPSLRARPSLVARSSPVRSP